MLLVASCTVVVTVSSLIVRYDERRLQRAAESGDVRAVQRLERAWPPASRDGAVIGLALLASPLIGVCAVFFHFFRTRSRAVLRPWTWSPWGFALGLLAALAVLVANAAVVVTLAYAFGIPLDD